MLVTQIWLCYGASTKEVCRIFRFMRRKWSRFPLCAAGVSFSGIDDVKRLKIIKLQFLAVCRTEVIIYKLKKRIIYCSCLLFLVILTVITNVH